jgi:hypothetical protein
VREEKEKEKTPICEGNPMIGSLSSRSERKRERERERERERTVYLVLLIFSLFSIFNN